MSVDMYEYDPMFEGKIDTLKTKYTFENDDMLGFPASKSNGSQGAKYGYFTAIPSATAYPDVTNVKLNVWECSDMIKFYEVFETGEPSLVRRMPYEEFYNGAVYDNVFDEYDTNIHEGPLTIKLKLTGKQKGSLKYATQMNSIRCQLLKYYPEAIETFGYITKANRFNLGVNKEHYYDACVIATEGDKFNVKCNLYIKKCVAKGDYQQTKGIRSEQKLPKGKICGFKKFDKVKYLGKDYFIKGRMSTGYAILMDIDGNKIDFSNMPKGFKTPKLTNCKREQARKTILTAIHPMTEVNGLLAEVG